MSSIEDRRERIRDLQDRTLIRMNTMRLATDYMMENDMRSELADAIRDAHPDLWHSSIASLPDGWNELVKVFLQQVHDLSEGMMSTGAVQFERTNDGLRAYVWANPDRKWDGPNAQQMLVWQRTLYECSRDTCEWCSKLGAQPVQLGEKVTFFLCEEHKDQAQAKLASKVKEFEDRVKFREEVSILFPPETRMVSLHVSDQNVGLLRKVLREIKKQETSDGNV